MKSPDQAHSPIKSLGMRLLGGFCDMHSQNHDNLRDTLAYVLKEY